MTRFVSHNNPSLREAFFEKCGLLFPDELRAMLILSELELNDQNMLKQSLASFNITGQRASEILNILKEIDLKKKKVSFDPIHEIFTQR